MEVGILLVLKKKVLAEKCGKFWFPPKQTLVWFRGNTKQTKQQVDSFLVNRKPETLSCVCAPLPTAGFLSFLFFLGGRAKLYKLYFHFVFALSFLITLVVFAVAVHCCFFHS